MPKSFTGFSRSAPNTVRLLEQSNSIRGSLVKSGDASGDKIVRKWTNHSGCRATASPAKPLRAILSKQRYTRYNVAATEQMNRAPCKHRSGRKKRWALYG